MGAGSPMQSVLVAAGVKDRKVLAFRRSVEGVPGLMRSIAASGVCSAFHVLDLGRIIDLHNRWLPGVRPYYAVKCNPEPALLGALAALGTGFDCASRVEIQAVVALGVHPSRIVYANPCKPEEHLKYASQVGVNLTTYDSVEEVAKVKRCHPSCELLLRIKGPENSHAKVDLGTKYGAHADEVVPLLRAAQRVGLAVAGVSFHVGSGGSRTDVYSGAIQAARAAFDAAAALGMPPMRVLDIGGGFVAGAAFDEAARVIRGAIEQRFGDLPRVEVIGEPGRYFAETAFTLAARVIGKRTRGDLREYWIDDGVYGSLNCIRMDDYVPRPKPLTVRCHGEKTFASTVFGPTCDSLDTVVTGYQLPEMSVGEWLVFDDMGAYTTGSGTNFNGFRTSDINTILAYSI
ncbi:ornithine decarboxylase-like [Lolium rigidum]|uniref:ornithine decarboxylase-like n=1 Tax=Lolium rigidum TaxID=89674 RepID=UPI001F5C6E4C|nr:ornithine decarboxylase-like [Lolium rigidum]